MNLSVVKNGIRAAEDWWFDATRSVKTVGYAQPVKTSRVVGEVRDSLMYTPVRAANAREAIEDLPIDDFANYAFIDIGSGKGRMLFVAAEYPFHEVLGVEFATELHEIARTNIQAFKHRKQRCTNIASININAADFDFPNRNLVVYIFNPFGPEVMKLVLENLGRSIASHPRHVVILLLWPEQSHMVAEMPGMNPYRKTRRYDIYQTCEGAKH